MNNNANEEYLEYSQYSSQLSALSSQKTQLKMIIDSIKDSIEEINESKTEEIYKNLGNIMIKVSKDKIVSDLKSELETIDVRIKTIEKQEDILTKKLEQIKVKLEKQDPKASKSKDD